MAHGESIFRRDGAALVPSEYASGPWDPRALHGGAPAALITSAFEALEPGSHLPIARLGFELLRPVPLAPLTLSTEIVRPGRRVQELAGELRCDGELICRAGALRVQPIPAGLPAERPSGPGGLPDGSARAMPAPESGRAVRFALDDSARESFASSAMEMRWIEDPQVLGPARVWMRVRLALLDGERASALASLAATCDFANGVSSELPFADFVFINADLTIHLHRLPRGEWIGIDARTILVPGGTGTAESVIHDRDGPVGRAFQTLVVQAR
jgi:hypothetical protein